jgi:hypothetical protein
MSNGTVLRSVRVDKDLADWFESRFPWRGSLPQFLNAALAQFKGEWGDRPTPDEVLKRAMEKFTPTI